ncbi:hypothetical protein ACFXKC_24220 [Streptomyces sp. NPDC059340]|uniref:hypothetical protein n=1 Tax=Streptomyces sp. NPDC059340 TaxID=3346806 RepID=UPI0036AFC318
MDIFCLPGDEATGGGYASGGANIALNRPIPSTTGSTPIGWQVGTPAAIALPLGSTTDGYVVCNDL